MKSNMKINLRKIATLMLALLGLVTLLSLMPEHSSAYLEAQTQATQVVTSTQH